MAIVLRFFSTTGAGAADGSSWADRAALFSAGNWSTVITGFAFNGADSLKCLIGPGSYTCGQTLAAGLFANAPSAANPLVLCGCDASGVLLALPDPDWVSNAPAWADSSLPVIATTTNIITFNLLNVVGYLLKLTGSGRAGTVVAAGSLAWCVVENSMASTAAIAFSGGKPFNCVFRCTGSSYSTVVGGLTGGSNLLIEGVAGVSGNRHGFDGSNATFAGSRLTIVNVGGNGVNVSTTNVGQTYILDHFTIANVGGTGFKANSTASQTALYELHHGMITGCGVAGIDGQSAARMFVQHTRLRDNNAQNIIGLGNYPTDLNNETTDSDDATEYVNAAGGDYRIKSGSAIHGQGYGVSDEPAAAGGGGGPLVGGRLIR